MPHSDETILYPLIQALDPRVIVEIGARDATRTTQLAGSCHSESRKLYSIDPSPSFDASRVPARAASLFVLDERASWKSINRVGETIDLALVDGRLEWFAIVSELRRIFNHNEVDGGRLPVVLIREVVASPQQLRSRSAEDREGELLSAVSDFCEESEAELTFQVVPGVLKQVVLFSRAIESENAALMATVAKGMEPGVEGDESVDQGSSSPSVMPGAAEAPLLSPEEAAVSPQPENAAALRQRCQELEATSAQERLEHDKDLRQSRQNYEKLEHALQVVPQDGLAADDLRSKLDSKQRELGLMTEERDAWRDFVLTMRRGQQGVVLEVSGVTMPDDDSVLPPMVEVPQLSEAEPLQASIRIPTVDVVICVYNAPEDVKACLESLLVHRELDCHIIIVDDESKAETRDYLRDWAKENTAVATLIAHPKNKGYTASVNSGLEVSTGDYVVLLNSDTIVTAGWLERMVECAESDSKLGIVGPMSNAASWQNLPNLVNEEGKFAINEIPEGYTIESFAALVGAVSTQSRPRVPFVNGFCYMISRSVIDRIGFFDVKSFPRGYGEENDYCLRAGAAGFSLALVDDAYVFHSKSKSFGHANRTKLSSQGKDALEGKHGAEKVKNLILRIKKDKALKKVRARVVAALAAEPGTLVSELPRLTGAERILFILPARGGSGGAHSVVQEVAGMRALGVRADVAVPENFLHIFLEEYAAMPAADDMIIGYVPQELAELASSYSVVVATLFTSMVLLKEICAEHPDILPAYYIQDYEPYFLPMESPRYQEAVDSYSLVPDAVLFAKTQWLVDIVKEKHGLKVQKVSPSLDHSVYEPVSRKKREDIKIVAMIRPATPRRAPRRTMKVLRQIQKLRGDEVSLHIFGCEADDPDFAEIEGIADCENHERLSRAEVAALLADADIFVDLSDYQAFGRTGLEAMACGCAVINPKRGGTDEYCIDGQNCLLVNTSSEEECASALLSLVDDDDLRRQIARKGQETSQAYSLERAARSELTVLQSAALSHRAEVEKNQTRRVKALVTTHGKQMTASAVVRIMSPLEALSGKTLTVKVAQATELVQSIDPWRCETLFVQLGAIKKLEDADAFMRRAREEGSRVVYEMSEPSLEVIDFQSRAYPGDASKAAAISRFMTRHADAVVVASEGLKSSARLLNDEVFVVPSALSPELWGLDKALRIREQSDDAPIRIVFIGTRSHTNHLEMIRPALSRLSKEYGERISFQVIGGYDCPPAELPTPFQAIPLVQDRGYPRYVEWLRRQSGWDIGLIPLAELGSSSTKDALKWLEYSALGLASVCSDVAPYQDVVRDGENGLLAKNTEDAWYGALKKLVEDADLRRSLADQARTDVSAHHTISQRAPLLAKLLDELTKREPKTAPQNPGQKKVASHNLLLKAPEPEKKAPETKVEDKASVAETGLVKATSTELSLSKKSTPRKKGSKTRKFFLHPIRFFADAMKTPHSGKK